RLVWEDRSTYLARHAPASGGDRAPAPTAADGTSGGEPLTAVQEWRLPSGLGRRHARVSGDYNPVHLYAITARAFGFPRAIAHGMWTIARCVAASPDAVGVTASFLRPVLLPSTVTYASNDQQFELRSHAGLHLTGTQRFT
ncbi:MAG: hypothetical protein HOY79_08420, partial [Streptomyces sp.]|nr:hypothetical protein [Streptomyces sp.]